MLFQQPRPRSSVSRTRFSVPAGNPASVGVKVAVPALHCMSSSRLPHGTSSTRFGLNHEPPSLASGRISFLMIEVPPMNVQRIDRYHTDMIRSHLRNTRTPRYRPIFSSARRGTGHSSKAYGARGPTPQSGKWAITLRVLSAGQRSRTYCRSAMSKATKPAARDFPPGRHKCSLKYRKYIGVAFAPPDRKIIGSGTHGYF